MFGEQLGKLALLVVYLYSDATDAYAAMTTAASAGDTSTPDQLLAVSEHSATDRLAALSLQRWESEGGALRGLAPPSQPHMHAENSTDQCTDAL